MGRIFDVIRRKKLGPSISSMDSLNSDHEFDKENTSIVGNINGTAMQKEALRLGNREVFVGEDIEACIEVTLSGSTSTGDFGPKIGSFETNDCNDSELVAVASSSESTVVSNAIVSLSELTEVSDDGILRDDEGNPIDPDEAEKNMLRDDEGNIIDPKSLVVRDFLLDLSCESDEYYDDSGEQVDPKELVSCIGTGHAHIPLVTDSSTHSEGEADCESEMRVHPLHEEVQENEPPSNNTQNQITEGKRTEISASCNEDADNYENDASKGRKSNTTLRRRRRRRSAMPAASDSEYVHIMFNNSLTTLQEESVCSPQHTDDSGDEADDESPASSTRDTQRSPRVRGVGSFDEKFIKARWEYSLQMMNCGGSGAAGAVIDVSEIVVK